MLKITAFILTVASLLFSGYSKTPGYISQTQKGEIIQNIFNKKELTEKKYVGAVSEYKWSEADDFSTAQVFTLKKQSKKDFKILNLADIHFSDFGYRVLFSFGVETKIRKLVADENPDLIILSGDFVCSECSEYSIRRLTDLMESLETPWAPVFGNHDREGNCDGNYLADIMLKSPHCIFAKGDSEMGTGNYIIKVLNDDNSLSQAIFMMDSHSSVPNEKQVKWFEWAVKGLKAEYGENIEGCAFMHVPLPEYETAYNEVLSSTDFGQFDLKGECNEKICCQRDENGNATKSEFFESVKSSGCVNRVFCSHDHMNDFTVNYEGVRLTYCMKIGKSSGYQPGFDGATVINIGEKGINEFYHISKGRVILSVK